MRSDASSNHSGDYEVSSPDAFALQPAVSVVLVTYNHGQYIERAIESVISQQIDCSLELLIGEDCSTDNTRAIAQTFQRLHPDIIRVITSDANVGALRNSRRLLQAVRGTFIAHLDGDDYWLPGKLARQIDYLREHANCAAVFTNAITIDRLGNKLGVFNDVGDAAFDLGALLRKGNFLNASSAMYRTDYRRDLLDIVGPYLDYQGHLALGQHGHIAQIGEPLTAYRVSSSSSMIANANDQTRELYWQAIQSVPRKTVSDDDYAHGIADFLRRVTFHAMRTRQWRLLRTWIPRVYPASPYGAIHTSMLTASSVVRIAVKKCTQSLHNIFVRDKRNVLYPR